MVPFRGLLNEPRPANILSIVFGRRTFGGQLSSTGAASPFLFPVIRQSVGQNHTAS
jgi:hypothetical protein